MVQRSRRDDARLGLPGREPMSRVFGSDRGRPIDRWYIERFLALRETVFKNPSSYFHRYAALTGEQAIETARGIWRSINLANLRENGRTSFWRRVAITRCGASGCERSEGPAPRLRQGYGGSAKALATAESRTLHLLKPDTTSTRRWRGAARTASPASARLRWR